MARCHNRWAICRTKISRRAAAVVLTYACAGEGIAATPEDR